MTTTQDPTPTTAHSAERRLFVHVSIVVAVALFVGVVALLFWRSYKFGEPNALWVIEGDASLEGAVVTVEGTEVLPIRRELTGRDNYIARIPVPPDVYSINVMHKGKLVYRNPAARIGPGQYGLVSRDILLAATTQPADRR